MNTSDKLTELARLRQAAEDERKQYEQALDDAIPEDVKKLIDEIENGYEHIFEDINQSIIDLEAEIKADVLTIGATVKGDGLMAVWNKGRVSWDSKTLDGYAVAHPEILVARKEGEPTVTIRAAK